MLLQWHAKGTNHSAKSAGCKLQLNTHTPLTQRSGSGLTMLSRHSVGSYQETSSNATRQETLVHGDLSSLSQYWTDPDLKSGIGAHELSSIYQQQQKSTSGNDVGPSTMRVKSHHFYHTHTKNYVTAAVRAVKTRVQKADARAQRVIVS